jgi:PAS domain S-box-containing protein
MLRTGRLCCPRAWRFGRELRSRLVLLVLATLLPLVLFATFLILLFAHEARRTTERGMRDTARALALAMDREVTKVHAILGVLARSRPLAAGDLAGFYEQCLEVLPVLPPNAWLTLSDRRGQMLLNTRVPYGTALPKKAALDVVQTVVATGRPSYSDLVLDALTQQPVVTLDVPVFRRGKVDAVISLTRPAATLGRLFREQQLPPGWVAGLNDRQHRIIARSREPERFIGAPVTPRMAERSAAAEEGWFANRSKEGQPVYTAISRVRSTGWTMALFAPAAVVDAPGQRFVWFLVSGGLVLSALAVGVALWLGRHLAQPIRELVPATAALAQGLPVPRAPAGAVQEVQEVAAALHEAAALLQQREAELHEQRERLHITLTSIGDAVIVTDSQSRVTFLNPVAAALTGWAEAEALGQDITAVLPIISEATRQGVENPVTRVLREGTVVGLANHTLLIARDGTERPIDDSGAPIATPDGQLLGAVLVFRDVTARRMAAATQAQLAAIVDSSQDAILGKTLEGTISSWNAGAERLYGYTAAEVLGRSVALLVPADRLGELEAILIKIPQGDRIETLETQRLTKDGRRLDVALTISPIQDAQGCLVGVSTIARDITERKHAEATLRHLSEQAQQAASAERDRAQELAQALDDLRQVQAQLLQSEKLAALGRLSAGMAHELNSPLQGLLGLLTVYLGRVAPASREADQLAKMRAACEHMAAILADLTAFARPASEDKAALELREVVETILGFSAVHLRHQDIRVTTHFAEPLPRIYGNKSQLQQVLLNLVQNASDAIEGTGEMVIRVSAAPPEVWVQVSDSGVGIAPEHLTRIFEPFFTTKLPGQGTGLGLAVTLGIVEAHGGTIHVESTLGAGTTVTVRLPISRTTPYRRAAPQN